MNAPVYLALVACVSFALSPLTFRMGWLTPRTAFLFLILGMVAGLIAATLGILSWTKGGGAIALVPSVIGLCVAAVPLAGIARAKTHPMIHDLSTDLENPPEFARLLALREGAPNPPSYDGPEAANLQRQGYPDLQALKLANPPSEAFGLANRAARELGWTVASEDAAQLRIEAFETSRLFGFTDDIVVRIRPEGPGSRLDVRSKSRIGLSDLGANAARIRKFLARVSESALHPARPNL